MTDSDRDPLLDRAISELSKLPPADGGVVSRIVAAAAAARVGAADDEELGLPPRDRRSLRWSWALGIAAAAAVAGFLVRGVWTTAPKPDSRTAVLTAPTAAVRPAADVNADARPVPKQFVFQNNVARRVSLVGDFNSWNPAAAPLTRDPASGLWTTVVPIAPGRHVYGFMIDDSVLVLDPRAPKTRDPALGVEASVVIVGKP